MDDWADIGAVISPAATYLAVGLASAIFVFLTFRPVVNGFTQRTRSDLDDILTARLRWPIAWSLFAAGAWYALQSLAFADPYPWVAKGLIATLTVVFWTASVAGTSRALLDWLVTNRERYESVVNDRSLPIFDIVAKTVVWGGSLYFIFLAWDVDLTGWLASAGVIGVAVGFAAKDTLSNLIAGVFILADAPYKLGDYLVVSGGDRGEVVEIGIRTTRLRTRDDVEIIVPNAVMANSQIINQSGGPGPAFRVRMKISVAYGSDVDRVRDLLMGIALEETSIIQDPAPRLRFREFGDSGLVYELLAWVPEPGTRGLATDRLLTTIYKAFQEHNIEIPYPKHDVYLHESRRDPRFAVVREED